MGILGAAGDTASVRWSPGERAEPTATGFSKSVLDESRAGEGVQEDWGAWGKRGAGGQRMQVRGGPSFGEDLGF